MQALRVVLWPIFANATARFGNFIGEEPEASEEGSEAGDAEADHYVYGDEDAEDEDGAGQELMEVDGTSVWCAGLLLVLWRKHH